MKEEFVPYELAVKLKQLGFNEPCLGFYERNQELIIQECLITDFHGDSLQCVAPLFQQAFRWFREEYNLESHIKKDLLFSICLGYESMIECEDGIIDCGTYKIYEEAELACIEKLIKIVETKQQEQ